MAKNWLPLIMVFALTLACGVATPTPTEEPAEEVVVETEAPVATEEPVQTEEIVSFETDGTTRDRYMEAFGMAGEFEWNVTALNTANEEICSSDFFTFTKPASQKSGGDNGDAPQGYGGGDGGPGTGPPPDGQE